MEYLIGAIVFLIVGTGLICIGAILATGRWNLLGRYSQRKKMMPEILLGAIAIAVGGLLTTGGWNKLDTHQQRNALISAVVQEWLLNQLKLEDGPFAGKVYDDTGKALRYPLFRESALNGVVTSGLFSFGNRRDRQLLGAIGFYLQSIEGLNWASTSVNEFLEQDTNSAEKYQRVVVDSHWYKRFKEQHEAMKRVLVDNYRWAISEQKQ